MPDWRNQHPACINEGINYKLYNEHRLAHGIAALFVAAGASLGAQSASPAAPAEMPAGLFRGAFAGWSGAAGSGNLTVRTAQGADLFCYFDSHSYIERDHRRIAVSSLSIGEKLEILADHKPGSHTCYARTAAVIDAAAERMAAERARQAKTLSPASSSLFFTPTGDRTVSGIVVALTSRALTLKTRSGETTLTLRPDTRYLGDGVRSERADLRVNAHVFIRAGKTIEGVLEAYQVMWGEILDVQ